MSSMKDAEDRIIQELIDENPAAILSIPGVYEILAEEWNNEIIKRLEGKE